MKGGSRRRAGRCQSALLRKLVAGKRAGPAQRGAPMARKTLDEAGAGTAAGNGRVAVLEAAGDPELALLRWGDWTVKDGALCLGFEAGNPFRIPLRRVGEQHWLAHFVSRGASAHDVACLALALRDLRAWIAERAHR